MSSDRCLLMMLKLMTSQHVNKQYGVFGLFGLQNRSKRLRGVGLVTAFLPSIVDYQITEEGPGGPKHLNFDY